MTLEDYLRGDFSRGVIDHSLRADVDEAGKVTFYIHPDGADGETLDFEVTENVLTKRENGEFSE